MGSPPLYSAARHMGPAGLLTLLLLASRVAAVHWYLEYGREECIAEWVPKYQWNVILESVAAAGSLPSLNVSTAEMEVQLETGVLVYTPERTQVGSAAVDITLKTPAGELLVTAYHTNEDERSITARGPRGPWQLCLAIAKTGKWYRALLVQVTHFNVNHLQLVGTHLEAPRTTVPEIQAAPGTPNATTIGPAPSVAQEQHVNVVKRALADVAVYLSGARWEVQHRNAVAFAQLQVRRQTAHKCCCDGQKSGAPWRFSLFSCFGKCGTCCYGFWCLPCLYGQNVSDAEPGSSCFLNCLLYYCLAGFGCCCLVHMQSRSRLRAKYGLMEKPCGDCGVTYFCAPCAVCQEANEIRDKSKNAAPMYGAQMAPPPQQHMHGGQYPPQQYPPPSGAAPPAQY